MSYYKLIIKAVVQVESKTLSNYLPLNIRVHKQGRAKALDPLVILRIPSLLMREVYWLKFESKFPQRDQHLYTVPTRWYTLGEIMALGQWAYH